MELWRFEEIAHSPDKETLERRLVAMANEMGFGIATAMLVCEHFSGQKRHELHVLGNIPCDYRHHSDSELRGRRDPVIHSLKRLSIPITYSRSLYEAANAMDLWEDQAPFGYKAGIAIALHLPRNCHFVVGFDTDQPLPKPAHLCALVSNLSLAAVYAEAAASRLLVPTSRACERPHLTARELDVLRWTHSGKTAWEIGRILGISERTVVMHLGNAMRKFKCASKHQAVLAALSLDLLN